MFVTLGFSTESLKEWGSFAWLGLPGMLVFALESWVIEIGVVLTGKHIKKFNDTAPAYTYTCRYIVYMTRVHVFRMSIREAQSFYFEGLLGKTELGAQSVLMQVDRVWIQVSLHF